jgi:molybdate transport system substrate-binding protein
MVAASICLLAFASPPPRETISVYAATSLRNAFTKIARKFESKHPGVKVTLTFDGSKTLAERINKGGKVDVFASASPKNLDEITYHADSRKIFTENRLTLIARKGTGGFRSPRDLNKVKSIVMAADTVAAGRYATEFLQKARIAYGEAWYKSVQGKIVSRERDVKTILEKVASGKADAGILYVSDALMGKGQVVVTTIPDQLNLLVKYPAAVPVSAPQPKRGREFINFLLTPQVQSDFKAGGFLLPAGLRATSR